VMSSWLTPGPSGPPKDQCKNDAWRDFSVFKNQGDCVSFVATGGKNPSAVRERARAGLDEFMSAPDRRPDRTPEIAL
jgi:hypothetical protein